MKDKKRKKGEFECVGCRRWYEMTGKHMSPIFCPNCLADKDGKRSGKKKYTRSVTVDEVLEVRHNSLAHEVGRNVLEFFKRDPFASWAEVFRCVHHHYTDVKALTCAMNKIGVQNGMQRRGSSRQCSVVSG